MVTLLYFKGYIVILTFWAVNYQHSSSVFYNEKFIEYIVPYTHMDFNFNQIKNKNNNKPINNKND